MDLEYTFWLMLQLCTSPKTAYRFEAHVTKDQCIYIYTTRDSNLEKLCGEQQRFVVSFGNVDVCVDHESV